MGFFDNHLSLKKFGKVVLTGILAVFTAQGATYVLPALDSVPQTAEVLLITAVYYAVYNYLSHRPAPAAKPSV